jgi:hypothetical protein
VEICGQAHQEQARRLIRELTSTLRATWFSESSILEVCELAIDELSNDSQMSITTISHFKDWVSSMLQDTTLRDNHSLPA